MFVYFLTLVRTRRINKKQNAVLYGTVKGSKIVTRSKPLCGQDEEQFCSELLDEVKVKKIPD